MKFRVPSSLGAPLGLPRSLLSVIGVAHPFPGRVEAEIPLQDPPWDLLHVLVVEIVRKRFDTGHYADAVEAALKEVKARVKKFVVSRGGEEREGKSLMLTALSVKNPIVVLADLSSAAGMRP